MTCNLLSSMKTINVNGDRNFILYHSSIDGFCFDQANGSDKYRFIGQRFGFVLPNIRLRL